MPIIPIEHNPNDIKQGMVVRLISDIDGQTPMSVASIYEPIDSPEDARIYVAQCIWRDSDSKPHEEEYELNILVRYYE